MRNKYTKELLQDAIKNSKTWADVCRLLNVKSSTGSQSHLTRRAKEFNIGTNHFVGKAHSKGKSFAKKDALTYCHKNSNENSNRLKKRLIRDGYKNDECENCGEFEWMGIKLPLELHHKDTDHSNNELDNIQILCPNCHSIINKSK